MIFKIILKYRIYLVLFTIVFAWGSSVRSQEPIVIEPQEIEMENDLIDAMQYVALEKYDEAIEKFKDIKDKLYKDGIAEFEIAKIYFVKGEYDEAEFYIKKAIEKDNSKNIYNGLLVEILTKNNKYEEAAKVLEKGLSKSYFNRKDYYKIADYYQKAGLTDKALAVLNRLENKTENDREVELYKYNILLRSNRYKKALGLVNNYLKDNPEDIQFLEKKALVFRLTNKESNAENVYNRILEIDPDNPKALSYMSAVSNFNKNEENYIRGLFPMLKNEKIEEDTKIKRLIPFVSKVAEKGQLNEAIFKAAAILLKQYPESAKSNTLYADLLYNSGEVGKSVHYYEKALKSNKNNFQIWKQLLTIYTLQENWKSLLRISEDVIDYYPNQVSGYYYAGRALVNLNNIKDGLDYLEEAKDYASENYMGEINLMEAQAYLKSGQIDKASGILNSLNKNFSIQHPYYWELKGDVEKAKGDSTKAIEYWNKSLQLGNRTKRLIGKLGK